MKLWIPISGQYFPKSSQTTLNLALANVNKFTGKIIFLTVGSAIFPVDLHLRQQSSLKRLENLKPYWEHWPKMG